MRSVENRGSNKKESVTPYLPIREYQIWLLGPIKKMGEGRSMLLFHVQMFMKYGLLSHVVKFDLQTWLFEILKGLPHNCLFGPVSGGSESPKIILVFRASGEKKVAKIINLFPKEV